MSVSVSHHLDALVFSKRLLVYVPAYNCRETIVGVLNSISARVNGIADILVVDNCSDDGTAERIMEARQKGEIRSDVAVVQPTVNVGYAGSQKLAYALACRSPMVEWVAMLHGDGQYPSELLDKFVDRLDSAAGIIYGHRSKLWYPRKEETPFTTWAIIGLLSVVESVMTGVFRMEWHSGFVMHATRFLRRVELSALTDTPHIDGHLLYAASVVNERVETIPIYKRYKSLSPFEGEARRRYVLDVLNLMRKMPRAQGSLLARGHSSHEPERFAPGGYRLVVADSGMEPRMATGK